jgi:hypothetical protein
MLSFELSAIDIVLVISVVILLLLYLKKFSVSFPEEKYFRKQAAKESKQKIKNLKPTNTNPNNKLDYAKCPRGYGDIRKLGPDNSVSEKCLGCYKIMECYTENK